MYKSSLPPAYVVRREGNVLTCICPSIHQSVCPREGGGVPISHNALQHFPECHGAATVEGGVPCQVQPGGTLLGGYPARSRQGEGCPGGGGGGGWGCTLVRYTPPARSGRGGCTQVGQQKEYSIHGGWYASCVHAGGLSCLKIVRGQIHKLLVVLIIIVPVIIISKLEKRTLYWQNNDTRSSIFKERNQNNFIISKPGPIISEIMNIIFLQFGRNV